MTTNRVRLRSDSQSQKGVTSRERVRVESKSQSKKHAKRQYQDNDRISHLSDDILLVILSLLPLNEAARTSVLSSRWRNLWKHVYSLNLDGNSCLRNKIGKLDSWTRKKSEYVKWVNSIMRTHKAPNLEELRICYDLSLSAGKAITRWLVLAFAKHVQRLELDLSLEFEGDLGRPAKNYVFPDQELLTHKRRLDFNALKELSLRFVEVTGETVEFLLRNCLSLEKLVIEDSYKLLSFEVSGPSLVLKHLEILDCDNLESIKVYSAPKLTKLIIPRVEKLLLEDVPMLVEVCNECSGSYVFFADNLFPTLSACIFQLKVLTIGMKKKSEEIVFSTFPELPKLKKLVVEIYFSDESLMGLTPLIRASPFLEKFVLKLQISWTASSSSGEVNNTVKFSHQHLKVFKLYRYSGCTHEDELLRYIVENCIALQQIVVKHPIYSYDPEDAVSLQDEMAKMQAAKDCMKRKLEAQVPQHIEIVMVDDNYDFY